MHSPPNVACILVNWNNWPDTSACLASLALQGYPALSVIVVDNASTNDSLAQLRAAHPWATYIENADNAGFPKACNLGARHAPAADYLWFLNNDTVVPPDTTARLVAFAQANPRAGVIGAVLRYAHDPAQIQAWGGGRMSLWTAYNRHYLAPTPFEPNSYITFASAFVPRACYDQLDGLTEAAFMYFEDADFSLRAHAAGWQLAVAPDTAILHKEGGSAQSAGQPGKRSLRLERIITTAGLIFLDRHARLPVVARALFLLSRIAKRVVRRDWPALRATLAGARDFTPAKPAGSP